MIPIPQHIVENLRFLIAEITVQLSSLESYFGAYSPLVGKHILDRSGYAYNLKIQIQNACVNYYSSPGQADFIMTRLRTVESVVTDLEHIAELCRNCVHYLAPLDKKCIQGKTYIGMIKMIRRKVNRIETSLYQNNTQQAIKIGDLTFIKQKEKLQKKIISKLKKNKNSKELVVGIGVMHVMMQMAGALLNISEAIISANLGQPLNIERYNALKGSLEDWSGQALDDMHIETIAETRSGSGISGVNSQAKKQSGYDAIFKDGQKQKLKEEKQRVEDWNEIFPGLAPKIISYKKQGRSAAILIEHLSGLTYQQIVLHESDDLLKAALAKICSTLEKVWNETKTTQSTSALYMKQLQSRLDEVYSIHPQFQQLDCSICRQDIVGFNRLLLQAMAYEAAALKPPFSVYIHGDFNVDNIIYDPMEKKVNFIDLHRSKYMDYVQDISVFMVSNFRLKVFDRPMRQRILGNVLSFYQCAQKYAIKHHDKTFEFRLALGLARSFATSTRFILDRSLAEAMFMRANYLLVLVLKNKGNHDFHLPMKDIFTS